jgi:hypothetical protein
VVGASNQLGMKFCLMLIYQDEMKLATNLFLVGMTRTKLSNARDANLLSSEKLT